MDVVLQWKCPKCGTAAEVRGLAPALALSIKNVVCGVCNKLPEQPGQWVSFELANPTDKPINVTIHRVLSFPWAEKSCEQCGCFPCLCDPRRFARDWYELEQQKKRGKS